MKETNHQKIVRLLREAKGGWVCTTVFDTEYIRDHRKRVSKLIQQGYNIISEQCRGECGRNHSSNIFKRKLLEPHQTSNSISRITISPNAETRSYCCESYLIFQIHERVCQKAAAPAKPTLF